MEEYFPVHYHCIMKFFMIFSSFYCNAFLKKSEKLMELNLVSKNSVGLELSMRQIRDQREEIDTDKFQCKVLVSFLYLNRKNHSQHFQSFLR